MQFLKIKITLNPYHKINIKIHDYLCLNFLLVGKIKNMKIIIFAFMLCICMQSKAQNQEELARFRITEATLNGRDITQ